MLSSPCLLNMKRLVTLKYKRRKKSKASSEDNLEVLSIISLNNQDQGEVLEC